jgi:hypothetical protein
MRYARRELGMRGGFLRPNPYAGRALHHPDYEPFWREAQELDFAIGLHEGASGGMPRWASIASTTRGRAHIISHTMEMMLAAMSVIWEGVCDRHPRLRIGFLESGGGWIAALARPHGPPLRRPGLQRLRLTMRPSELFQRNCWISFEPVEGSLSVLGRVHRPAQDPLGDRLPAPRRLLPRGARDDRPAAGPVAEAKRQIMAGGAMGFYALS